MTDAYSFGRFTLDPAGRSLYAEGTPVPLGATRLRLLLALLERAGTTVTKEELISRVWGRVAVSDHLLYVHMSALRKTLGEDCIVNKQGRGYRFMAGVRQGGAGTPNWTGGVTDGASRLIGRREHLRFVSELLERGRLVTLTGHGGIGKTRLALKAASEASSHYRDGVWLIELAALGDAELVPGTIASTLGIEIGANAKPLDTLSQRLARKSILIVLDNCEHVLAACARTAEALLAATPNLKILATSREPLSCSGEQVFEVPPLTLPREGGMPAKALRRVPAVELFVQRATGADAAFHIAHKDLPIVARICRHLDGLPLVIEMAAAWAGVLGLEVLDQKLDQSLNTLLHARSTAPTRHSTLGTTLEWSYDLLSPAAQTVLCRLALFTSSFTIAAAEQVAGCDAIPKEEIFGHVASLSRKSMIVAAPAVAQVKRYRLLETTRAFMLEKLVLSGGGYLGRYRHARYVLGVLEEASREFETTSDAVWVERYAPVLDDLRAALDWTTTEDFDFAIALAGVSCPLWRELSLHVEGTQRLSKAAALLSPHTPPALEARLRSGLGELSFQTPGTRAAYEEIERAATLYRALGDAPRLGSALSVLAFLQLTFGRADEAEQAIQEAIRLLEPAGWLRTLGAAYSFLSCIDCVLGRFDAAFAAGEKAAYVYEVVGAERAALVVAANLVQVRLESGDLDGTISAGRNVAARLRDTRYFDILGYVLGVLAAALTERGDLGDVLAVACEAAPLLREVGSLFWLFDHLALRAALAGRVRDAALIAGYADSVHQKSGRAREPMGRRAVEHMGRILREVLTEGQVADLDRLGAQLTEDQILAIALKSEKLARPRGVEPLLQD